jgi:hypothetical protein
VYLATHLGPNFSANASRKTDDAPHSLAVSERDIRIDLNDHVPAMPDAIPLLFAAPLHTLAHTGAVRTMQPLIFRGALDVREIAQRACAQDGLVDGEMELSERLLW